MTSAAAVWLSSKHTIGFAGLFAKVGGEVQTGEDAEKVTELRTDFSKPQSASNSVKSIKLKIVRGRNIFLQKIDMKKVFNKLTWWNICKVVFCLIII